jgi:hypothetical protein
VRHHGRRAASPLRIHRECRGLPFPVMTANQHDMSVATNVANRLREAVLATRATNQWFPDQLHVLDLVQHSVAQWAYDIGATLRDIDDALASSRASPDREEVHDHDPVAALEDALVGAVGVRDRLRSLAVLVFGAKCLRPAGRGVRFEPSERDLRRRLGEIAGDGFVRAGQVKLLFEEIADHDAIHMRNAIVHALAPFPQLTPTCWIQKAILNEEGHILAWESGALYPRGSLDQPDGNPVTLFRWASETAADARERLIHLTSELATLIEEVGEVAPPPSVWVPTSGPALLARPTTSSLIEDGLTYGDERS